MAECCVSGGRVVIQINGKRYSARTAAQIEWLNTNREVVPNQDGTIAVMFKPTPPTATFTLSNTCGLDLNELAQCSVDVTFDMIDARKVFYFTDAYLIGKPTINSETGEISNLKITANEVKVVNY